MRVLIVGAGAQGGPCAAILARDPNVSKIVIGDLHVDIANKVKQKIKSDKLEAVQLNAKDIEQMASIAKEVDVIIDLVVTSFAPYVMEAAVQAGVHYINSAFEQPFMDQLVEDEPILFDKECTEANRSAILGCGGSPGLTNILIAHYCKQLDEVKSIKIYSASVVSDDWYELVKGWKPVWSPFQALSDFNNPPVRFKAGQYEELPIFFEPEQYEFPFHGKFWNAHHMHEEVFSLPRKIGKGLSHVQFKFPVDEAAGTLIKTGLASSEEIEVKGVKVRPIDLLLQLIPSPGDTFFADDTEQLQYAQQGVNGDEWILEIDGVVDGKDKSYRLHSFFLSDQTVKSYELFGTANVFVALPVVIGAKMAVEGSVPSGVVFSEELNTDRFIELLNSTGIELKWSEL